MLPFAKCPNLHNCSSCTSLQSQNTTIIINWNCNTCIRIEGNGTTNSELQRLLHLPFGAFLCLKCFCSLQFCIFHPHSLVGHMSLKKEPLYTFDDQLFSSMPHFIIVHLRQNLMSERLEWSNSAEQCGTQMGLGTRLSLGTSHSSQLYSYLCLYLCMTPLHVYKQCTVIFLSRGFFLKSVYLLWWVMSICILVFLCLCIFLYLFFSLYFIVYLYISCGG